MTRDEVIHRLAIGIGMVEGHAFEAFGLGRDIRPGPNTVAMARSEIEELENRAARDAQR